MSAVLWVASALILLVAGVWLGEWLLREPVCKSCKESDRALCQHGFCEDCHDECFMSPEARAERESVRTLYAAQHEDVSFYRQERKQ